MTKKTKIVLGQNKKRKTMVTMLNNGPLLKAEIANIEKAIKNLTKIGIDFIVVYQV